MVVLKKIYVNDEQPQVHEGLWLKKVDGGFSLYLIEGGNANPLKLVDDNSTATPSDDRAKMIVRVTDIKALTTKQCNALNVGDQIIKKTGNMQHLYTVTYKEEKQGMCLTYMDAENVETVSYDYNGTTKQWEWTDTVITPIGS